MCLCQFFAFPDPFSSLNHPPLPNLWFPLASSEHFQTHDIDDGNCLPRKKHSLITHNETICVIRCEKFYFFCCCNHSPPSGFFSYISVIGKTNICIRIGFGFGSTEKTVARSLHALCGVCFMPLIPDCRDEPIPIDERMLLVVHLGI